jgi:LAS superfamily LD-carboxypeptidase LdcB
VPGDGKTFAIMGVVEYPVVNELELTGRTRSHVVCVPEHETALHRAVVEPFRTLCAAARADGIQLAVASGFRDFDRQVHIWNAKVRGKREIVNRNGTPLDAAQLTEAQLVEAILAWSALPGASRHHWGSDIDVYDAVPVKSRQRVRLHPDDWTGGGIFSHLDQWLTANLDRYGFYRPYERDRGGVCPEPWHISYVAVSNPALAQLRVEMVADALTSIELAAKATVLAGLPTLFDCYVHNVAAPPS